MSETKRELWFTKSDIEALEERLLISPELKSNKEDLLRFKSACLALSQRVSNVLVKILDCPDLAPLEARAQCLKGNIDYLVAVCLQNLTACKQVKPLPQRAMPRGPAVSKHGVTRDRSRPAIPIPQGNSFKDRERISSDIRRSPQKPILSGSGEHPQAAFKLNPEAVPFSGNFVGLPRGPAFSGLCPIISSGQPQNDGWLFNYYGIQPRPQLTLAKFDGDALKFGNFRRQFGKYVEEIYSDYNDGEFMHWPGTGSYFRA